ncbi:VWA domain-containing protein [Planctomicrobium sp.]|nr:vWA domain-containing protein [Planctomicrobium sp.]MDB4731489.1 VWA domain-containing protein [bacterium]MDB4742989.1 VWA domain-containing protein [Planctomicrobium sp.]
MLGKSAPPVIISIVVHAALLGAMAFYKLQMNNDQDVVAVETVIADERAQQEFEQDLTTEMKVSENMSVQSGGMVTTNLGAAAAQPTSQTKIETSEAIQDPEITVTTIADISIPGLGEIALDLGEGEVSGEVGARVEGYGAAMHRITQELTRMMKKEPVMAVWLFDASNSLKDDRKEISDNFHKIYEELNIAKEQATSKKMRYAALETMICSYGEGIKKLMPKPSGELEDIRKAIGLIKEDESGKENTFSSISAVIDEYGAAAARSKRKLAIIVLTDETGDDEGILEEVIAKTERSGSPVYFLGREAIFGYPYTRVSWTDPEPPNLHHWIRVDRGPETAFPECLQYDGFGGRWDSASSGFGPYGQVRLAKKSGGIFFLLNSKEANLIGSMTNMQRKFDDLAMKEYEPLLLARREYESSRAKNEFRQTIWQVIVAMNPHSGFDPQLNIRRQHYPMEPEAFEQEAGAQFAKTVRAMAKIQEAVKRLDGIKKLRAEEREPRWRAAYDLAYAQLLSYRVRQFQLLLALDKHAKEDPKPKDPKANEWNVRHIGQLLAPDEKQIKATKVDTAQLEQERTQAVAMYNQVIKEHPGTPWAQRAQAEKTWGFGIDFTERFWDPKYNDPKFQARVPKF